MTVRQSRTQMIPALPDPIAPLTQAAFAAVLDDYFSDLSGDAGVAVRDLETGTDFGYHATEIFPTASTLKVPLIYTLYRLADAGEIDLSERVTLCYANRVPGSGVLQHMDEGLQPTLRDLAELMIIVSDNWATDLLWNRLTRETVNATMAELGLTQTSLPHTIFELFATMAEVEPATTSYDFLRTYLKDYDPAPDNPGMVYDARNDTSSPADMVRLLALIDAGEGLSESSREAILNTLKHQNFTTILQGRLPTREGVEVAHKTGSLRGVKNDVGLVYGPNTRYAIALMSRGQDDIPEVTDRLSRLSRWIYDSLSAPSNDSGRL